MSEPADDTNVAHLPVVKKSVIAAMADRFGMEPKAFEAVVRDTCMPPDRKTGEVATPAEFAAFLLVCKEHNLNPVTREIYAMRRQGGSGLIPVVSVDGWIRKINEDSRLDGIEFAEAHDDKNKLVSTTCRIWRKDRSRPVEVTEYYAECKRETPPWQTSPHRMLRHKSLIQCARVAFGFAGIYDEDEAARFAEPTLALPAPHKAPPAPPQISPAIPTGARPARKAPPIPGRSSEAYAPAKPEVVEDTSYADLYEPAGYEPSEGVLLDYQAELEAAETEADFDAVGSAYAKRINEMPMADRQKAEDIFNRVAKRWVK